MCVQEKLQGLKQSIEFMADLKTPNSRTVEDGEEEGLSSDPAKDGSSPMDTSDNSQSPRVASRDTPRYSADTFDICSRNSTKALTCQRRQEHLWLVTIKKYCLRINSHTIK